MRQYMDGPAVLRPEEQRFLRVVETLRKTAVSICAVLDFDQLLHQILEQVGEVIVFDSASISLLEDDKFRLKALRGFRHPEQLYGVTFPAYSNPEVMAPNLKAIRERRSIRMGNVPSEYPWFVHPPETTIYSWLTIPLCARDQALGTLNLDSQTPNHFTAEDQQIAELFAAQVSVALENARLYGEIRAFARQQTVLNEVLNAITSKMGMENLLSAVDDEIARFFCQPSFLVALHEPVSRTWRAVYGRGMDWVETGQSHPLSDGLPGLVIATGESLHLRDAAECAALCTGGIDLSGRCPQALIGVPMRVEGQVVGAMLAVWWEEGASSTADLQLFKQVADRLSPAVQNARRFAEIERSAQVDMLTGLMTREHFFNLAAGCSSNPYSILMVDLDHFKAVNDAYGHCAGDAVLRHAAQTCSKHLRRFDLAGRYGGEEFIILLPETALKDACHVAERLCQALAAEEIQVSGQRLRVTASLGAAESQPGEPLASVIERADTALYQAKRSGRNRVISTASASGPAAEELVAVS